MLSFLSCAGSNGSRFNELKELFFGLSFVVHFFVFSWFYDFFWSFLIVAFLHSVPSSLSSRMPVRLPLDMLWRVPDQLPKDGRDMFGVLDGRDASGCPAAGAGVLHCGCSDQ